MSGHGIRFNINSKLFIKDPQDSTYGNKLLKNSILLMNELGFESFTFKKLAQQIQSTEASIYRYFQNKHLLLLYISSWYWEWVNYLISIHIMNIEDPADRLQIVIHHIVNASTESPLTDYINENILHQVVIKEGSKTYHIQEVDNKNKDGFFQSYVDLVNRVASFISAIKPDFPYSKVLASNLLEMSNNQIYFSEHLPKLTDIKNKESRYSELEEAMIYMVFKVLS